MKNTLSAGMLLLGLAGSLGATPVITNNTHGLDVRVINATGPWGWSGWDTDTLQQAYEEGQVTVTPETGYSYGNATNLLNGVVTTAAVVPFNAQTITFDLGSSYEGMSLGSDDSGYALRFALSDHENNNAYHLEVLYSTTDSEEMKPLFEIWDENPDVEWAPNCIVVTADEASAAITNINTIQVRSYEILQPTTGGTYCGQLREFNVMLVPDPTQMIVDNPFGLDIQVVNETGPWSWSNWDADTLEQAYDAGQVTVLPESGFSWGNPSNLLDGVVDEAAVVPWDAQVVSFKLGAGYEGPRTLGNTNDASGHAIRLALSDHENNNRYHVELYYSTTADPDTLIKLFEIQNLDPEVEWAPNCIVVNTDEATEAIYNIDTIFLKSYAVDQQTGSSYCGQLRELNVSLLQGPVYAQWAGSFGLVGSPDSDPDYDYDGDGVINLHEYGLGGDPTNAADKGVSPVCSADADGSTFNYIYPQLSDPNRVVGYSIELADDLVSGVWSNAGYTVTGTNIPGGSFDYITNSVPLDEDRKFIRLLIDML